MLSITSGYMVPMANYADLNNVSKLSVHQEMRVPQHKDKENECTQQPGQCARASRQALRTVIFSGELLSESENIYLHVKFKYEG